MSSALESALDTLFTQSHNHGRVHAPLPVRFTILVAFSAALFLRTRDMDVSRPADPGFAPILRSHGN